MPVEEEIGVYLIRLEAEQRLKFRFPEEKRLVIEEKLERKLILHVDTGVVDCKLYLIGEKVVAVVNIEGEDSTFDVEIGFTYNTAGLQAQLADLKAKNALECMLADGKIYLFLKPIVSTAMQYRQETSQVVATMRGMLQAGGGRITAKRVRPAATFSSAGDLVEIDCGSTMFSVVPLQVIKQDLEFRFAVEEAKGKLKLQALRTRNQGNQAILAAGYQQGQATEQTRLDERFRQQEMKANQALAMQDLQLSEKLEKLKHFVQRRIAEEQIHLREQESRMQLEARQHSESIARETEEKKINDQKFNEDIQRKIQQVQDQTQRVTNECKADVSHAQSYLAEAKNLYEQRQREMLRH